MDKYSDAILQQCPKFFSDIVRNWQHGDDWKTRLQTIDEHFIEIELEF